MHSFPKLSLALSITFTLLINALWSQTGIIRGEVIDEIGEPLFSANAIVTGTQIGTTTDFDGQFEVRVDPGTYTVEVSFIGYASSTVTGVVVKAGEATYIGTIKVEPASNELAAVTITAEAARNTEAALLTIKRKSPNLIDGISAANFRKIGDSDAGAAVKRVTGVSVEGGKYVYVRGLGDRYTKTTLNGLDIPGLDPDRNSLQIDIFPTNLINNMTVLKSGLAELPADFTGGIVDIETKAFPETRTLNFSLGFGYNPAMHFNSDYIAYDGGATDFLGFDDGTRALSERARNPNIPTPISGASSQEVNTFLKEFSPTLGAVSQTSLMNFDIGLSFGDQKALDNGNKLGYIFSLSYKNDTRFYDQVAFGEYQLSIPADEYELVYATTQDGILAENNVLLGGLGGIAYKTQNAKYKFTIMHLQNGESRSAQFFIDNNGSAPGQSGYEAYSDNLEYNQRGLTNLFLGGTHFDPDGKWEVDWKLSPTISTLSDPDIRKTAFTVDPRLTFAAGAGGNPIRIWRSLNELNAVGRLDITRKFETFNEPANIKFGVSHIYKTRDYEILSYDVQFFGEQPQWVGDPNEVLLDSNLYPNGSIYYQSSNTFPNPSAYSSNVNNTGIYVSTQLQPFVNLKAVLGLRGEYFVQRHTGRDVIYAAGAQNGNFTLGNNLVNEKVLDAFDLFPTANIIYSVNENQNLRFSYTRSIARPSFKELSFAQIIDPVSNRIFNGGLFPYEDGQGNVQWDGNLSETRINNFDVRWELFLGLTDLLSVSGFYKTFDDPIELVRVPTAFTSNEFQPRNVGQGQVIGAEVEIRKGLFFIAPALQKFAFAGNLTIVDSRIDMTEVEFKNRKGFEKEGQTITDTRAMAGQAPWIVNAGISFEDLKSGLNAGVFYNVKGSTLIVVGGGLFPDVYAEPFHALNFTLNKTFGEDRKTSMSLKVSNILNDLREQFFENFQAERQVYYRYNPGFEVSIGFNFNL